MRWIPGTSIEALRDAVESFDRKQTEELCACLIAYLRSDAKPYDSEEAREILELLKSKRFFDLLQQVGDVFMQGGTDTPSIRKLYAQALIDQDALCSAVSFLEDLVEETSGKKEDIYEHAEAQGLLGRTYKQIYVERTSAESGKFTDALNKSINAYHSVYLSDPEEFIWHGINAAALLKRAAIDKVKVYGIGDPDWRAISLSQSILDKMGMKWENRKADMWDCAIAMEACITLDRFDDSKTWLDRYVREPYSDAFELASTLRQMHQVWRLDKDNEPGATIIPILEAELLTRQGGELVVTPKELKPGRLSKLRPENLEKVLGDARYVSYKFMLKAVDRARAVARIEHQPGQGYGTGFLIWAKDLSDSYDDELLLLTNSHVISDDKKVKDVLRPDEAIITFQLLREEQRAKDDYAVKDLVWTSPPWELDATLLQLESYPENIVPYPVAPRLPLADQKQRVYVIGHPKGGSLSFSIQDNLLLDHEAPRIHYRAPTEGGSSGSPVFNAQWKLIGLHHAGSKEMFRLNNKGGQYAANEGIWIQSIRSAINS